jgi:alkanesulfonate monooxygenase SsuD/methylene tetrahydromethanopterin reductase-like flavin-dependent oxidoreductase (luciferase family)
LATICVWALAADTEAEARRLMTSRELWRIGREKGPPAPLASPEQAAAYQYTDAERVVLQSLRDKALVGTAGQVTAKLRALASSLQLDEIVINTWTYDPAARARSCELLAREFGLVAVSVSAA